MKVVFLHAWLYLQKVSFLFNTLEFVIDELKYSCNFIIQVFKYDSGDGGILNPEEGAILYFSKRNNTFTSSRFFFFACKSFLIARCLYETRVFISFYREHSKEFKCTNDIRQY